MSPSKGVSTGVMSVFCGFILGTDPAMPQTCGADFAGAERIESPDYLIFFRTLPTKIAVGEHFSVEFALCPRGNNLAPSAAAVDARMPDHRHGMNYRPTVKKFAGGYRADGLMFHMPGRWELSFELNVNGKIERVERSITVN